MSGMKEFEERLQKRKRLSEKVIELLKDNHLTYSEAIEILKDTQQRLERASLKNMI